MLSRKITDGCEFVVFDMEWNQPFPGKTYSFDISTLTGEIIEIGAVRYSYDNGALIKHSVFSEDIAPVIYTQLHYHVKKVTHKKNSDLAKGRPFSEVYADFRKFCGVDCILVGWGNSDPAMLKMNLRKFGMNSNLDMFFLDLQPIFSTFSGQRGKQRSVESAVDYYQIEKNEVFHSATADALYTGEIFEEIFRHNKPTEVLAAVSSSSVDPDVQHEFGFVGREALDVESAMADADGFISVCPVCKAKLSDRIPPFRLRKSRYGLKYCDEHGEMFCRTRVKKNKAGRLFSTTVMRFATQTDYYLVASKREEYDKFGISGAPAAIKSEENRNEE